MVISIPLSIYCSASILYMKGLYTLLCFEDMKLQKFRWSKVYESTEEELVEFLAARNLSSAHWAAEAFNTSDQRTLETPTTLWCAEGSFTIRSGGMNFSMQPGDALPIPADVSFETTAGISGCICYETPTKQN